MIFIVMSNILITEKQLEELVKTIKESSEEELEEGFLGDLGRDIGTLRFGNIFAGLKGAFTGKGYSLSRSMNIIKNSLKRIRSSERTMLSAMKELKHVEVEFSELETTEPIVSSIISNLRGAISNYDNYRYSVKNLQNIVTNYYESQKDDKKKGTTTSKSETLVNPTPKTQNTPIPVREPDNFKTSKETVTTKQPEIKPTVSPNLDSERYFRDWISGEYKLPDDDSIYYLTASKRWEVRKPTGNYNPLKDTLNKDEYEKRLEKLKTATRR
jgi:hypothetical protein